MPAIGNWLVRVKPRRFACAALATFAAVLIVAQPAGAAKELAVRPLHVARQSAVYSRATGEVSFTLRFNRTVDLESVDQYGRRRDSFQYFIVGDPTLPYPENYDAIIRGEEATLTGHGGLLPIRRPLPPSSEPASGGWGPIRAVVPFGLSGPQLTFSGPLSDISDHSADGHFTYRLETYNYGVSAEVIEGESVITD